MLPGSLVCSTRRIVQYWYLHFTMGVFVVTADGSVTQVWSASPACVTQE